MKYSVLILMAGCCKMATAIPYGNTYGTPFIDREFLRQGENRSQQFDPRGICFLEDQDPIGTYESARRNTCFSETQAPINMNGNDCFYDDFDYQEEKDLQNRRQNLLNVRLLLQNSKRNYEFKNNRLFRWTKQGREEINPIEVLGKERSLLLEGERCFYDKEVLKFILCSSNEDIRELDKIVPKDDAYNMFVFDKDTARYFYVARNKNNLPVGLVPLELVHKTKNEKGQDSSFLKIMDSIYEVCDGTMIYVGTYREVESDCYVDTYGKVWHSGLYQGSNRYGSQQNQIMRVVDNYSQNMNIPNNINSGNYIQQCPQQNQMLGNNSNLDKIMHLVDNYSNNMKVRSNVMSNAQKIQVTGYLGPNRGMRNSLTFPNSRSRTSTLPFQSSRR